MKKRYITCMILLILFFLGCSREKREEEKQENTYRVVAAFDYAPFIYIDEKTGEREGFVYEIVKEIEKRGQFKFEWYNQPFSKIIDKIVEGRYDIGVSAFTITEERKKLVDFTEPFYKSEIVVLGNKEIEYDRCTNTIYGVQTNSVFEEKIEKISGNKTIVNSKEERLIATLVNKEIDYLITDFGASLRIIEEHPQLFQKEVIEETEIGLVVSKKMKRSDLKKINNIILEMTSDGTIEKLKNKYGI